MTVSSREVDSGVSFVRRRLRASDARFGEPASDRVPRA